MEKRGVAAIAILPSGSISGHFVDALSSQCFGLFGTQIACERECSRGEDYKLINLSILDFQSKKEVQVIVESHGQDAARFYNAIDIHGWEEHVMDALQRTDQGVCVPSVRFECEILKADEDAELHIQKYLPSLVGRGAIVNIGTMDIRGLKFETTKGLEGTEDHGCTAFRAELKAEICHGADSYRGDENSQDKLQNAMANGASTSISVSENRPYSGCCMTSSKEFTEILQEELELEGLPKHKYSEPTLMGWREKRVLPQASQDLF